MCMGEAVYCSVIGSVFQWAWASRLLMSQCFLVFPPLWVGQDGQSGLALRISRPPVNDCCCLGWGFPAPGESGSHPRPAGRPGLTSFSWGQALFGRADASSLFPNGCFFLPSQKLEGISLLTVGTCSSSCRWILQNCEDLLWWSPLGFLSLRFGNPEPQGLSVTVQVPRARWLRWASALLSHDTLCLPVSLPSLGDRDLPSVLSSLVNLGRADDFWCLASYLLGRRGYCQRLSMQNNKCPDVSF